tara:strand:+ start:248 stop:460 length:213 start_codon:yes stop_codon:yes gene_type:complete
MAKKKTVKISDINKEISDEMRFTKGINDLDKAVNTLLDITQMLEKRIDFLREDLDKLELKVIKVAGRMGI